MKYVYVEDNQMYYKDYYLIKSDASASLLEILSKSVVGSGRFSTSVTKMKEICKSRGVKFKIKKYLGRDSFESKYLKYDIVFGAIGNY